ncbi:hypothetical protein FS837_002463, partial [Tulasnella sp. UAMH 9824]
MSQVPLPPITIPTPAAAPPVAFPGTDPVNRIQTATIQAPNSIHLSRKGRMKVLSSNGRSYGYLAARSEGSGKYRSLTERAELALMVSIPCPSSRNTFGIEVDPQGSAAMDSVGITWYAIADTQWVTSPR